jgi:sporulation protein YlmC with PRC-barrel domain/predicted transcriptional regulator
MAESLLFLTELLGLQVFDLKGRKIGVFKDAAVVPVIDPSRIDRFLISGGMSWWSIRFDQVRSISLDGIFLRDEKITPYHSDEYMLRTARDLLDQQIIDAHGRKVVRVNDVTFEVHHEGGIDVLRVLEVDIGIRSILRRVLQGVLPPRWIRKLQGRIAPNSIRWEYCSILEPDPLRRLRLNISSRLLEEMHPADLADIVEELGPEDREAIFEALDSEVAAETLSEVDPDIQASILESLETEKAAEILEEMSPAEAADVLSELEEETSAEILEEMHDEPQEEVRDLLEYEEDTAGGLMNTEYIALPEAATVGDAFDALRGQEESILYSNALFLIDAQERLCGVVPLARFALAPKDQPLADLKLDDLIQADVEEHQDRIAELFDKYNLIALPVTDQEGKLAGVITADDIISVLRQS